MVSSPSHSLRFPRAWGPVNRWSEVVDIDLLRRLFENALDAWLLDMGFLAHETP